MALLVLLQQGKEGNWYLWKLNGAQPSKRSQRVYPFDTPYLRQPGGNTCIISVFLFDDFATLGE